MANSRKNCPHKLSWLVTMANLSNVSKETHISIMTDTNIIIIAVLIILLSVNLTIFCTKNRHQESEENCSALKKKIMCLITKRTTIIKLHLIPWGDFTLPFDYCKIILSTPTLVISYKRIVYFVLHKSDQYHYSAKFGDQYRKHRQVATRSNQYQDCSKIRK